MRRVRNNVFETNSSSTHTLSISDEVYELPKRKMQRNWRGEVLPVNYDEPNIRIEMREFYSGSDNSDLTHIEWMASYLYTLLNLMKFSEHWQDIYKYDESWVITQLEKFHRLLLQLELTPKYGEIKLEYQAYDYNMDKQYPDEPDISIAYSISNGGLERNDGSNIESKEEIEDILKDKESLKEFLTHSDIYIEYCG